MRYKVYVNVCDFRAGSYVTLGTEAAQCAHVIRMIHAKYFCIWSTGLERDF